MLPDFSAAGSFARLGFPGSGSAASNGLRPQRQPDKSRIRHQRKTKGCVHFRPLLFCQRNGWGAMAHRSPALFLRNAYPQPTMFVAGCKQKVHESRPANSLFLAVRGGTPVRTPALAASMNWRHDRLVAHQLGDFGFDGFSPDFISLGVGMQGVRHDVGRQIPASASRNLGPMSR